MDEEKLNQIVDDLYLFFPLFRKKLFKPNKMLKEKKIPRSHYHILKVLKKKGELSISEISRMIHISKSNMTSLIDKLVVEGLVERLRDENDRRVINIAITEEGLHILDDWKKQSNNEIKMNLSSLSEEDLQKFYDSVENIKIILSKMSND